VRINDLFTLFGTTNAKKILFFGKLLILMAMLWYLYVTLQNKKQGLADVLMLLRQNVSVNNAFEIGLVLLLTPLNWAFEALKWKTLAQKLTPISFLKAFEGVLTGLTLGFFLPNNVGDAAGRLWLLPAARRSEGVGAALLANGLQFYGSLLFGTLAWAYLLHEQPHLRVFYNYVLLALLILTLVFGVWLLARRHIAEPYFLKKRWLKWLLPYVRVIGTYHIAELRTAFGWALGRYAIFTLQFALLLHVFGVQLPFFSMMTGIFLVFFAKTLVPALNFLGDLGIREAASLYFFSFYEVVPARLVATTLSLWLVNILVPVLIGVILVIKRRWQ
jgi:Lysylphosphatidylglycerol synthase TM region